MMKIVKFLKQRKYLSKSGYLLFSVISSSSEQTFSSSIRNSLSHLISDYFEISMFPCHQPLALLFSKDQHSILIKHVQQS